MISRSDIYYEVLTTIRKIIRAVDMHSKRLRLETGVTAPQLIVLQEILHREGDIITTNLADQVSLSQSTVTNILDRLVEKNLVKRIRDDEDKRMWLLELTENGKAIVENSPPLLQKEFIENFSILPEWQQTQIVATLQRVAAMMYQYCSDDGDQQPI